jgi:hypothetical protein
VRGRTRARTLSSRLNPHESNSRIELGLLEPQSGHHAVPNWDDAAHLAGLVGNQPVVLPDEGRKAGKAFSVSPGCDVHTPNRVVTQPQATDPKAVTHRTPAVRVSVLVDVAIHHVEAVRFLRKTLERIPDPVAASEPTS